MPAPYVRVVVEDQSTRVAPATGVYAGIVIDAKKGPVNEPVLITSQSELLTYFTPNSTIEVGWDLAYLSAYFFLRDSNRLWAVRAAKNPLFGGVVLKTATSENSNIAVTAGMADPTAYTFSDDDLCLIYGADPGVWNNDVSVTVDTAVTTTKIAKTFQIDVYYKGTLKETWLCSNDTTIKNGYGYTTYLETVLNSSKYIKGLVNTDIVAGTLPKGTYASS